MTSQQLGPGICCSVCRPVPLLAQALSSVRYSPQLTFVRGVSTSIFRCLCADVAWARAGPS